MSEDKTQATTETVSESPATETTQDSSNDKLKAERAYSQKQRNRAQDAETRLAKLEKSLAKAEEVKLKEKEDFKALYEKASSDIDSLTANADKWNKYEEIRRGSLLEKHPEEDREKLSKLDLDSLEYVTSKVSSVKTNAPEAAGNPRKDYVDYNIDWTKMDAKERRAKWDDIIASASKNKN